MIFKNKKALSGVVIAVIMIAIVVSVMAVVIGFTRSTVEEKISQEESCRGVPEQVTINSQYVCWDSTKNQIVFSISVGDVSIDEVLVSISSENSGKTFVISSELTDVENLWAYSPSERTPESKLPSTKSGSTYIAGGFEDRPNLVQIAPRVGDNSCGVSDSLRNIVDCSTTNIQIPA